MLKEGQETQSLSIDQLVGRSLGNYHIEKLLGRGELSTVYIAQQPAQGRKVMITMFKFPAEISVQERAQLCIHFAREASILVQFTHPNIIPMYDFGELFGYPYLVTAFVEGASLRQLVRQQGRLSPQQVLTVLKQVASALDYAHSHGVVHDLLSLSNLVINQKSTVQIVGFGLKTIVEVHRGTNNKQSQMLSKSDSFLESLQALGASVGIDNRSDIYALGVILFELLSGRTPFSESASNASLEYLQSSVPSIHAICPDVPEAFDIVIAKALEPDPVKRYAHAEDMVAAFERVSGFLGATARKGSSDRQSIQDAQVTLPPIVNWFDETGKWRVQSPAMATRQEPAKPFSMPVPVKKEGALSPVEGNPDSIAGVDPFSWWSATGAKPAVSGKAEQAGTFSAPARSQSRGHSRRKVISRLAVGAVGIGVLAVGGVSLVPLLQSKHLLPFQFPNTASNSTTTQKTGATAHTKATPTTQAKKVAQNPPAPKQQPTPTSPPKQQPAHTGTVIGNTNQAPNSATIFTNPADGQSALLIRLPNGNFVAGERACRHQQVPVNYDPATHMILCPAHGAIYDPANGFTHVTGPGSGPLAPVTIRMNADGTITTG